MGVLDRLVDMRYIFGQKETERTVSLAGYLKNKGFACKTNKLTGDIVGDTFFVECKNGGSLGTSQCDRLIEQVRRYAEARPITHQVVIVVFDGVREDIYQRLLNFQGSFFRDYFRDVKIKMLGPVRKR